MSSKDRLYSSRQLGLDNLIDIDRALTCSFGRFLKWENSSAKCHGPKITLSGSISFAKVDLHTYLGKPC
jgi:hypothetical protein